MSVLAIAIILFAHWLADFVLQTDYQAKNKSSSQSALASHIFSYTLFILTFTLIAFVFRAENWEQLTHLFNWLPIWAGINGICHYVVDFFSSRLAKKYYKESKIHEFFMVVGMDQFIHTIFLIWTYKYVPLCFS